MDDKDAIDDMEGREWIGTAVEMAEEAGSNTTEELTDSDVTEAITDVKTDLAGGKSEAAMDAALEKGGEAELVEPATDIQSDLALDKNYDGGRAWLVVAGTFFSLFNNGGIMFSFGVFLGYLINVQFAGTVPASQLSLISSLQAGCGMAFGPFIGRLTDRYGSRTSVLIGCALQVIGNIGASFSLNSVYLLWLFQGIIFGTGCGFTGNGAMSAPAGYFSKRLSLAFGIGMAGSGIGGLTMSFVTQKLLNTLGPAWTLRIYAIMNVAILVPCAIIFKRRTAWVAPVVKRPFFSVALFKNWTFLRMFLGVFIATWGFPAPFFLPSFAYDKGLSSTVGSTLLAINAGVGSFASILAGNLVPYVGSFNLLCITQFCCALTIFMFWMPAQNVAMLYVYAIGWGLNWGCFMSLLANTAAKLFGALEVFPVIIGSLYVAFSLAFFANAPGAMVDLGATYENGARTGANYLYAQVWAGSMYMAGVLILTWVRFDVAKWKLVVKV